MDLQKYQEQWSTPAAGTPAEGDAGSQTGGAAPPEGQQPGYGQQPEYGQQPGYGQPAPPPSSYPPPYPQQPQPTYQTPPPYQQGYPAGYQQPVYPPAGYQRPGYNYGTIPNIPSYMGWAIATLILCFWPTGIVAVVFASRVGNRLALGDIPGAQEASRKAKMWTWITFGIGVALWIIVIVGTVLAATSAVNSLDTLQFN